MVSKWGWPGIDMGGCWRTGYPIGKLLTALKTSSDEEQRNASILQHVTLLLQYKNLGYLREELQLQLGLASQSTWYPETMKGLELGLNFQGDFSLKAQKNVHN